MGSHNNQLGVIFFSLFAELLRDLAFPDYIIHLYPMEEMGHAGVTPFYFFTYRAFVLVFILDVHQHKVQFHTIGNVYSQVYCVCGAFRKIKSYKYFAHNCLLYIFDDTKLHNYFEFRTFLSKKKAKNY